MVLSRDDISKIVEQALGEIGMVFDSNADFEATTIARIRQQLRDVSGSAWNPSPDMLAGLIILLFLERKNYPRKFKGNWFDQNSTLVAADLLDYLNEKQVSLD